MIGLKIRMIQEYVTGTDNRFVCLLVSDGEKETYIKLNAEADGSFKGSHISAMLRHFADTIDRNYSDKKEAA